MDKYPLQNNKSDELGEHGRYGSTIAFISIFITIVAFVWYVAFAVHTFLPVENSWMTIPIIVTIFVGGLFLGFGTLFLVAYLLIYIFAKINL